MYHRGVSRAAVARTVGRRSGVAGSNTITEPRRTGPGPMCRSPIHATPSPSTNIRLLQGTISLGNCRIERDTNRARRRGPQEQPPRFVGIGKARNSAWIKNQGPIVSQHWHRQALLKAGHTGNPAAHTPHSAAADTSVIHRKMPPAPFTIPIGKTWLDTHGDAISTTDRSVNTSGSVTGVKGSTGTSAGREAHRLRIHQNFSLRHPPPKQPGQRQSQAPSRGWDREFNREGAGRAPDRCNFPVSGSPPQALCRRNQRHGEGKKIRPSWDAIQQQQTGAPSGSGKEKRSCPHHLCRISPFISFSLLFFFILSNAPGQGVREVSEQTNQFQAIASESMGSATEARRPMGQ